jgi:FlaA1/EpsC-like NDP-sugar epimerase
VRRTALKFSPSPWQLTALDALAGVAAVTFATLLRFLDEGSVPATYAQRLLPWFFIAAVVQMVSGEVMTRLRRPGSVLARRPVAPFLVAIVVSLALVTLVNDGLLREPLWHLPHFVSLVWPVLACAASAALRLAAARSIDVEELLTRPVVQLDVETCSAALAGKRVLITGAAGSIGAELARQVLSVGPADVLGIDTNETGLYELQGNTPGVRTCIADVADSRRMRELFLRERPHVIFHAAAYKHVPLVEANPDQGFAINVLGTLAVCEAAVAAGAERVVVISTDKAVNPSSFMGLTKRAAELMIVALSQRPSAFAPGLGEHLSSGEATVLSAVRFGNVLGSRGSVVPTLLRQIEAGGPITITHPEAHRYFMTVAEAASLVLLSAAHGAPGGLFVLDMGDEVRIETLAERLVRLKGLRPGRDISIRYIGLRPGEKLREELHSADEQLVPTERPGVWRVASDAAFDGITFLDGLRELESRRQVAAIEPADYPRLLRELITRATGQTQPVPA